MTQPEPARNGTAPPPALTPKQEDAALATAKGLTIAAVAKAAGAGVRTVKTWRSLPAFQQRVSELRQEMTGEAVGKLTAGMGYAASTLRSLLDAESDGIRLSAARSVLELTLKLREQAELEAEVAALREQVAQLAANRGRVR